MSKASDIPPVGAGNAILQINHRNSKQPRQKSKGGQKHEQAPTHSDNPDQHDSHIPSSGENHQGVDRYV